MHVLNSRPMGASVIYVFHSVFFNFFSVTPQQEHINDTRLLLKGGEEEREYYDSGGPFETTPNEG